MFSYSVYFVQLQCESIVFDQADLIIRLYVCFEFEFNCQIAVTQQQRKSFISHSDTKWKTV